MRVGLSPQKDRDNDHQPARVTVCLLTFVPEQTGYYAHRFDVLKLCVASLIAHTPPRQYDLFVHLKAFAEISADRGHFIPEEWEAEWLRSTGRSLDGMGRIAARNTDVRLEYRGVRAYGTATHFQFMAPRSRHVKHIGNVVTEEFLAEHGSVAAANIQPWKAPGSLATRLVRTRLAQAVFTRLHRWSYTLLHYRDPDAGGTR